MRSISASAISGFVRAVRCSAGTPARFKRARSLVQLSGRKRRSATVTGTSPRASVSDTSVWQLAVLPNAEAYCAATPTECLPFFGIDVSSITNTASLPPTSLSAWMRSSVSSEPPSRRQQQQNGAADHSHPAQDALPLAERSCDHPVRSAPPRKVDTFAAVTCDPSALGTARASAQARLPNPTLFPPWPVLPMPTTHESLKN